MTRKKEVSATNPNEVKLAMAVESKYLYARDDAMKNSNQNKVAAQASKTNRNVADSLGQKQSRAGPIKGHESRTGESLVGQKRKY